MAASRGPSPVRFDAHSMYHDTKPAKVNYGKQHRDQDLSALPQPPFNVVKDPRFGECLVWRPVEGPPLPRRFSRQAALPPRDLPRMHDSAVAAAAAASRRHDDHFSPGVLARVSPTRDRTSPPRGQLLRRGKGGIDDVLKNAREAQSLFYTLQDRRLQAEFRNAQSELKADLDQQRQYKRMLELAAYQEELVNLYGPTMRDIIADTFFDDGHDPVLAMLRVKRDTPATLTSSSFDTGAARSEDCASLPLRRLWQHSCVDSVAAANTRAEPSAGRDSASRDREELLRALDERRCGRRSGY